MIDQDHFLSWQGEHAIFLTRLYHHYHHLAYSDFLHHFYQGYSLDRLKWLEEHLTALEQLYQECCPSQLDYPISSFLDLAYTYSSKSRKRTRAQR